MSCKTNTSCGSDPLDFLNEIKDEEPVLTENETETLNYLQNKIDTLKTKALVFLKEKELRDAQYNLAHDRWVAARNKATSDRIEKIGTENYVREITEMDRQKKMEGYRRAQTCPHTDEATKKLKRQWLREEEGRTAEEAYERILINTP